MKREPFTRQQRLTLAGLGLAAAVNVALYFAFGHWWNVVAALFVAASIAIDYRLFLSTQRNRYAIRRIKERRANVRAF